MPSGTSDGMGAMTEGFAAPAADAAPAHEPARHRTAPALSAKEENREGAIRIIPYAISSEIGRVVSSESVPNLLIGTLNICIAVNPSRVAGSPLMLIC